MIYCMSDVHGDYEKYRRMLEKIRLSDGDLLYLLGDVVDRGPHPVRILLDMMQRPNVKPLLGNHEYMAVLCLRFLTRQVTEESVSALCAENFQDLINWQREGGSSTLREFGQLSSEQRSAVLEYLMDFELYEEIQVNGQDYLLVHAGPANFSPDRPLDSYGLHELIWTRLDYGKGVLCGSLFGDRAHASGDDPRQYKTGLHLSREPAYCHRLRLHLRRTARCNLSGYRRGVLCGISHRCYPFLDSKSLSKEKGKAFNAFPFSAFTAQIDCIKGILNSIGIAAA